MSKRVILLISILLLSVVAATENAYLDVSHNAIKNTIGYDEDAEFELTITSKSDKVHFLNIDVADSEIWKWVHTDPLSHGLSENKLFSGDTFKTKLIFKPDYTTWTGLHNVQVRLNLRGVNETLIHILPIYVGGGVYGGYVPNLKVDIRVNNAIDPRDDNFIEVYMRNRNFKDFDGIKIHLDSELLGEKDFDVDLGPNEEKTIKVPLELERYQKPMNDIVEATVEAGGYTFTPTAARFEVIDYTEDYKLDKIIKRSFLKTVTNYKFTNDGNTEDTQRKNIEVSSFQRLFLSAEPSASLLHSSDGNSYYSWELTLKPGEMVDIVVTKSYRLFTFVLLLVLTFFGYYYYTKSPIIIKKYASHVEMKEGGISEMKILLDIKNNSKKNIQEMFVLDKVPNLADIKPGHELGTISPDKVLKHEKEGTTLVRWRIQDLDPYEHRLISYKIKARLSIIGGLTLQPAKIRYRTLSGKTFIVRSNILEIK